MNRITKNKLVRKQLEESLKKFQESGFSMPPQKGWFRAIRESLGMKGRQLGKRLNVSRQRIEEIEKGEISGSVTMKTMRAVAEALDCFFVYGVIPKKSLEETLKNQAEKMVKKKMAISSQTMFLENQHLSKEEIDEMIRSQIEEIVNNLPKSLWDDI